MTKPCDLRWPTGFLENSWSAKSCLAHGHSKIMYHDSIRAQETRRRWRSHKNKNYDQNLRSQQKIWSTNIHNIRHDSVGFWNDNDFSESWALWYTLCRQGGAGQHQNCTEVAQERRAATHDRALKSVNDVGNFNPQNCMKLCFGCQRDLRQAAKHWKILNKDLWKM